jgi:hypothetical protein
MRTSHFLDARADRAFVKDGLEHAHIQHTTSPSCKMIPMKRYDFPRQCWTLSGVLVGMALLFAIAASAQTPSIEGTYQLISRKLSDGTVLSPPHIMGLFTYTKTHRNFNI